MPSARAATRSALLFVLAASACARAPGPEQVLDEYFARLRKGDVEGAYALTTPAFRARRDLAAFSLLVARQPTLDSGELRRTERTIVVELAAGGAAPVRVVGARTPRYLAEDPLDLYPAASPEAALRSFARAVLGGRRDRIVALSAPAVRDRLGPATEPLPEPLVKLAQKIEATLGPSPTLVVDGATARWLSSDGIAVTLERTPVGWSVVALD